jgi:hypothetical protein
VGLFRQMTGLATGGFVPPKVEDSIGAQARGRVDRCDQQCAQCAREFRRLPGASRTGWAVTRRPIDSIEVSKISSFCKKRGLAFGSLRLPAAGRRSLISLEFTMLARFAVSPKATLRRGATASRKGLGRSPPKIGYRNRTINVKAWANRLRSAHLEGSRPPTAFSRTARMKR